MGLREFGAIVRILGRSDAPVDIWIRDWGFVGGVFFRYEPDYAQGLYSRPAILRARGALERRIGVRCRNSPLVLDGGNLVHGVWQSLTVRITASERPTHSADVMLRGAFRNMEHHHYFERAGGGTTVRDVSQTVSRN